MVEIKGNMTALEKEISDALSEMLSLENDRSDVNAEMQAIREKLNARGIPKKALAMARTYLKLDPEDREGFDIAYALVRKAGGLPLQDDLFAQAERKAQETPAAEGAKEPDPTEIEKVIRAQDADKVKGKKVHEPVGEHKGALN